MKKAFRFILLGLSVLWMLMVLFKIYLGVTDHVDVNGRGPADHFLSAFLQFLLVLVALYAASRLRK